VDKKEGEHAGGTEHYPRNDPKVEEACAQPDDRGER
jgi:hypothetical protein